MSKIINPGENLEATQRQGTQILSHVRPTRGQVIIIFNGLEMKRG